MKRRKIYQNTEKKNIFYNNACVIIKLDFFLFHFFFHLVFFFSVFIYFYTYFFFRCHAESEKGSRREGGARMEQRKESEKRKIIISYRWTNWGLHWANSGFSPAPQQPVNYTHGTYAPLVLTRLLPSLIHPRTQENLRRFFSFIFSCFFSVYYCLLLLLTLVAVVAVNFLWCAIWAPSCCWCCCWSLDMADVFRVREWNINNY